ncbi:MAG: hypothetical protein K0M78_07725, partial [Brevundimonas sp.]|nr:hypothetical protein [Brevundimonas sp.]
MRNLMRQALTPLAVLLLAACGADDEKAGDATEQVQPSSRSQAAPRPAPAGARRAPAWLRAVGWTCSVASPAFSSSAPQAARRRTARGVRAWRI